MIFVTLGFEDEVLKLEEDNGNDAGVVPRRMLTDRVAIKLLRD